MVRFINFLGLITLFLLLPLTLSADSWDLVHKSGELRWGADPTGGAPYVFADPQNPSNLIGFEVDLMLALSRELGVKPRLVSVPWDELIPALERGDYDVAFNGLEITAGRQRVVLFTRPYYIFVEQMTVRRGDRRFSTVADLRGHRIGTLSASLAQSILSSDPLITVVPYPSPVESYKDLQLGRTDAALFDAPIAAYYAGPNPQLENLDCFFGRGLYGGAVSKNSPRLKAELDRALDQLMKTGQARAIYNKWHLWNSEQKQLGQDVAVAHPPAERSVIPFVPLLLRSAGMTILLSVASMIIAVSFGFALCLGNLYGSRPVHHLCVGYVELARGTPLLVQLYLLYYGLPNVGIQLNAFVAAIVGVGLNYAAYESEIYRAGILSVPRGQDEAARSLGLTRPESLRFVIIPQALRTILPPSTNDFIALFKDTSLVSVITVTELTRAYNLAATTTFQFLNLGLITAALYFLMSYPLARWARTMERRRNAALH